MIGGIRDMSQENHAVLRRSFFIVLLSLAFMLLFAQYVHAEPDDDTYVFVTKSGIVWHKYRDCGEIVNRKAWVMTYGQAKKLNRLEGECDCCYNEEARNKEVTAQTFLYKNGFSEKEEVDWKKYQSSSDSKTDKLDLTDSTLASDSTTTNTSDDSSTKSKTSKTTASSGDKSATASSGKSTKTTGSDSSSGNTLMTDKQRKSRFRSKTNPKMGTKVKTESREDSAGYSYANFGTYNSYNSENGLGGTPIYLLGTFTDVQAVKQSGSEYQVAVMVNDCDKYQWYMRCKCDKDKYELLKKKLKGKTAYIYGTYSGYSGVTNRPMMDMTSVIEVGGDSYFMSDYE